MICVPPDLEASIRIDRVLMCAGVECGVGKERENGVRVMEVLEGVRFCTLV